MASAPLENSLILKKSLLFYNYKIYNNGHRHQTLPNLLSIDILDPGFETLNRSYLLYNPKLHLREGYAKIDTI